MESFAEKDFVICVWIEVTYIEKFTGRSDQTLILKLESVQHLPELRVYIVGKVVALEGCSPCHTALG